MGWVNAVSHRSDLTSGFVGVIGLTRPFDSPGRGPFGDVRLTQRREGGAPRARWGVREEVGTSLM